MLFKCECCGTISEEPIYVRDDNETFIVCSEDCEKLMSMHDPYCSCNTCMALLEEIKAQLACFKVGK